MPRLVRAGALFLAPALLAAAAIVSVAHAQFGPPSTVLGSIADSSGKVPEDVVVTAFIGGTECGKGKTYHYAEGEAQVTLYVVDVVSEGQTPGCGKDGAEITLQVGDKLAEQTASWRAGAVRLDLTFGDIAPAVIPTATPTATRAADQAPATSNDRTPGASGENPAANETPGTIPAGSPGAGSPVPTKQGGVTSAQANAGGGGGGGDGGFPVWGIVMLVLGGIAAVGGGVGYAISRGRSEEDVLALED